MFTLPEIDPKVPSGWTGRLTTLLSAPLVERRDRHAEIAGESAGVFDEFPTIRVSWRVGVETREPRSGEVTTGSRPLTGTPPGT